MNDYSNGMGPDCFWFLVSWWMGNENISSSYTQLTVGGSTPYGKDHRTFQSLDTRFKRRVKPRKEGMDGVSTGKVCFEA